MPFAGSTGLPGTGSVATIVRLDHRAVASDQDEEASVVPEGPRAPVVAALVAEFFAEVVRRYSYPRGPRRRLGPRRRRRARRGLRRGPLRRGLGRGLVSASTSSVRTSLASESTPVPTASTRQPSSAHPTGPVAKAPGSDEPGFRLEAGEAFPQGPRWRRPGIGRVPPC